MKDLYDKLKEICKNYDVQILCAKAPPLQNKSVPVTQDILIIDTITILNIERA